MLKKFDIGVLESIAKVLGDTDRGFTGSEIAKLLAEAGIADPFPDFTKRKRLFEALQQKQEQDRCIHPKGYESRQTP
jgi:hypothetical protein